jgi:hypothetical protein
MLPANATVLVEGSTTYEWILAEEDILDHPDEVARVPRRSTHVRVHDAIVADAGRCGRPIRLGAVAVALPAIRAAAGDGTYGSSAAETSRVSSSTPRWTVAPCQPDGASVSSLAHPLSTAVSPETAADEERCDVGVPAAEVAVRLERVLRAADTEQARPEAIAVGAGEPPFSRNHSTVSASSTSLQMYE